MNTLDDQIQAVFTRRVLGNRLVNPPVTIAGSTGLYVGAPVWFISNTYPDAAATVLSFEQITVGDLTTRRKVWRFSIRIDNAVRFFRTGEVIEAVSAAQLKLRVPAGAPEDTQPTEWNADHTIG